MARPKQPGQETLRQLLQEVLDALGGISGREFARRAEQHGLHVSYTTINNLLAGRHTGKISPDTIKAIAIIGRISEKRVRAAVGVVARDNSTDPQLLALHGELSPEEKREGLRLYREFVRGIKRMRASSDDHRADE